MAETTVKVTKNTVTISELQDIMSLNTGQIVQLKDADPNELQLFIDKMPASIKGESVKYNFSKLWGTWLNLCADVWKQADQG